MPHYYYVAFFWMNYSTILTNAFLLLRHVRLQTLASVALRFPSAVQQSPPLSGEACENRGLYGLMRLLAHVFC